MGTQEELNKDIKKLVDKYDEDFIIFAIPRNMTIEEFYEFLRNR